MGVFGKLAFWKRKEDNDLGLPPLPGPGDELGLPEIGQEAGGYPAMPRQQQEPDIRPPYLAPVTPQQYQYYPQQAPPRETNRDLELVSAKLDSIRASLESINQRLANIERVAYREEERPRIMRQW